MVEVTCNPKEGLVYFKIGGDNFQDLVETLKYSHCRWNPELKKWQTSIAKFDDVKAELLYAQGKEEYLEISAETQSQLDEYFKNLKELRVSPVRCVYHPELMHFGPLEGKHPYENFQMHDLMQAINRNRYLFAWEMGLGKSWALAALIEHLRYYNKINKCLVFSSGIGVWNVKSELIKFGANMKDEDIKVFTSISDIKKYEDRDVFNVQKYPYKTIIMTYDCLKSISNYYYDAAKGTKRNLKPSSKTNYRETYIPFDKWAEGKPLGLFLDENHLLGNPSSRRSEIMRMNLKFFDYRYEFTGTLADVYQKLYIACLILDKSLVKGMSYTDWLTSYNEVGNRFSRFGINKDAWDLNKLSKLNDELMSTYGSKRLKKDCLDLPFQYEVPPIWMDMTEKQRDIYETFSSESVKIFQKESEDSGTGFSDKMRNMFSFFQLAVDNPEVIKDSAKFSEFTPELQKKISDFDYTKDYRKLEAVDAIIEERVDDAEEPGILWTYHPKTIKALAKRYAKYKPTVIDAELSKDERFKAIDDFKKNKGRLVIASITVMNSSITLTECKWECYIEKVYNYTVYAQSRGRIYRPGQTETTRTYQLCYNNSIDQLQLQNLQTKGATLDSLLSKNFITSDMWKTIFNPKSRDEKFQ